MNDKWKIPTVPESKTPWDLVHEQGYSNVWSVTPDESARNALFKYIPDTSRDVLIPGCGSETHLQRHLIEEFPLLSNVICTDWSQKALDRGKASYSHKKINYQLENTANLSFLDNTFDVVIIVNSILSSDDSLNRSMINECCRVLRSGGTLVGFFPTIYSPLDTSYLFEDFAQLRISGDISTEYCTFYERTQDTRQIFYTPLRLAIWLAFFLFMIFITRRLQVLGY